VTPCSVREHPVWPTGTPPVGHTAMPRRAQPRPVGQWLGRLVRVPAAGAARGRRACGAGRGVEADSSERPPADSGVQGWIPRSEGPENQTLAPSERAARPGPRPLGSTNAGCRKSFGRIPNTGPRLLPIPNQVMAMNKTLAAAGAVAALLVAGCAQTSAAPPPPSTPAARATAAAGALPAGVTAVGTSVPVAAQGWTLRILPFSRTTDAAGTATGYDALRTEAVLTNNTGQVAELPYTQITVRYGSWGRPAPALSAPGQSALPGPGSAVNVAPGQSFTAPLSFEVPASAAGEAVTVTAAVLEQGLAEPGRHRPPGRGDADGSLPGPGGRLPRAGHHRDGHPRRHHHDVRGLDELTHRVRFRCRTASSPPGPAAPRRRSWPTTHGRRLTPLGPTYPRSSRAGAAFRSRLPASCAPGRGVAPGRRKRTAAAGRAAAGGRAAGARAGGSSTGLPPRPATGASARCG